MTRLFIIWNNSFQQNEIEQTHSSRQTMYSMKLSEHNNKQAIGCIHVASFSIVNVQHRRSWQMSFHIVLYLIVMCDCFDDWMYHISFKILSRILWVDKLLAHFWHSNTSLPSGRTSTCVNWCVCVQARQHPLHVFQKHWRFTYSQHNYTKLHLRAIKNKRFCFISIFGSGNKWSTAQRSEWELLILCVQRSVYRRVS